MDRKILRLRISVAATVGALVLSAAACGQGLDGREDTEHELRVLVGPGSRDETASVRAAVRAWSGETGRAATVGVAADMPGQLAEGFASGSPPDVFTLGTDHFAEYAANGFLSPYGAELEHAGDFHPALAETFTVDDELICAPKEFSALALVIDTRAWKKAGLTAADHPETWEELEDVATRLTTKQRAGLVFPPEWQRIGAFMSAAGGRLVDDRMRPDADTPENLRALSFAKDLLTSGSARFPSDVGAAWGGEALGTGAAAMTIEGNWVVDTLRDEYPRAEYTVAPLPAGPGGPGTLQFPECWGVAAGSGDHAAAVDLVRYLTGPEQQLRFAEDYGAIPTVASAADAWEQAYPGREAFLDGVEHAQGIPPVVGLPTALADVNARLADLPEDDPKAILTSIQSTLETVG